MDIHVPAGNRTRARSAAAAASWTTGITKDRAKTYHLPKFHIILDMHGN